MKVTKRNGSTEPVYFDKISIRLSKLIEEGNLKKIDPVKIAQQVIQNLYDGISIGNADAVLAASIFHFGTYTVQEVKEYLHNKGINMRMIND